MQPGSIVERTKDIPPDLISEYPELGAKPLPPKNTPFVIKAGPYKRIWGTWFDAGDGIKMYTSVSVEVIELEEYPGQEWNIIYFSEIQPPQEIQIKEIIADCEPFCV